MADLFDSLSLSDSVEGQTAQTKGERKAAFASQDTQSAAPPSQSAQSVAGVRSSLFPHQLAGLRWMARREAGVSAEGTSPLGGIVADEPGLGKTLMMLALVAHSKKSRQQQQPASNGESVDAASLSSQCTLVVCPRAVLRQWQRECSVHLEPGLLTVASVAGGSGRAALTAADIAGCDVVVASYETVRSQHQQLLALHRQAAASVQSPAGTDRPSAARLAAADVSAVAPLFAVSYLRLVADEAHRMRNRTAQSTAAVCALSAAHRWYVTATPLQNAIDDLYSAFLFLKYAPYSDFRTWKQYMHSKDGKGVERCRTLLRAVAIRRRKTQQTQHDDGSGSRVLSAEESGGVQLTPKHVQLVELTFKQQSAAHAHNSHAAQPGPALHSLTVCCRGVLQGDGLLRRAVVCVPS